MAGCHCAVAKSKAKASHRAWEAGSPREVAKISSSSFVQARRV